MDKKRITFFGLDSAFNVGHIGGTNSIIRRLAVRLKQMGDDVTLAYYGCSEDAHRVLEPGIEIIGRRRFDDALSALDGTVDHVISVYVLPRDRLSYARFRRIKDRHIRFHHICLGWNESVIKRQLLVAETQLFPFNGQLFCISPRIHRWLSKWCRRARLLLPPVSGNYFINPDQKPASNRLRLTYCGRLDGGKGTIDVSALFSLLGKSENIAMRICGFPWPHMPESLDLHKRFLADSCISYEPIDYERWTSDVDDNLRQALVNTDILLLPYRELSSTVDTPLLLLEGMASLCAIISPRLGDLHQIYGNSFFNLDMGWDSERMKLMIEDASRHLKEERFRVYQQNKTLCFNTNSIADSFKWALEAND